MFQVDQPHFSKPWPVLCIPGPRAEEAVARARSALTSVHHGEVEFVRSKDGDTVFVAVSSPYHICALNGAGVPYRVESGEGALRKALGPNWRHVVSRPDD